MFEMIFETLGEAIDDAIIRELEKDED